MNLRVLHLKLPGFQKLPQNAGFQVWENLGQAHDYKSHLNIAFDFIVTEQFVQIEFTVF